MTTTTLGQLLLNDALPSTHQIKETTTKKHLNSLMADLARTNPTRYTRAITDLKRVGDAIATDEGITTGLDDIAPDYAARDRIFAPGIAKIKSLRNPDARRRAIEQLQSQMVDLTRKHPGQMAQTALSGARGNVPQLMRTVTSPVAIVDDQNNTVPWVISKSYAEGLKAPDAWIAMSEARRNAIESNTSVAAPGEVNKILIGNMSDQIVSTPDCGTTNGITMSVDDLNAIDRYDAKTGQRLTAQMLAGRKGTVIVRSPMTCEAGDGVCQKCYGLTTKGQSPQIGYNVGMIAAHAMGEPLTQMTLSAKHATRTAASHKKVLQGLEGFKQLTEIPQSFFNKATLADQRGKVTNIKAAPQGGHYVHVNEAEHYVPPQLNVFVRKGDRVEPGDVLSDGIPKPDEIVKYKGLGAGRKYLVDQLSGIYERNGIDLDKKHLELLAKTDLNYVRIMDRDSARFGVARGDVINYNKFRLEVMKDSKPTPIKQAVGATLSDNVLHYTAGTHVTPAIVRDIQQNGIQTVPIAPVPMNEPIMKPISRTPLLYPNWLAKLGHRNLKNTLLQGAAFGEAAEIHGAHPIPSFVFGEEFGEGPGGRY